LQDKGLLNFEEVTEADAAAEEPESKEAEAQG
jgi:hypothetical protein